MRMITKSGLSADRRTAGSLKSLRAPLLAVVAGDDSDGVFIGGEKGTSCANTGCDIAVA